MPRLRKPANTGRTTRDRSWHMDDHARFVGSTRPTRGWRRPRVDLAQTAVASRCAVGGPFMNTPEAAQLLRHLGPAKAVPACYEVGQTKMARRRNGVTEAKTSSAGTPTTDPWRNSARSSLSALSTSMPEKPFAFAGDRVPVLVDVIFRERKARLVRHRIEALRGGPRFLITRVALLGHELTSVRSADRSRTAKGRWVHWSSFETTTRPTGNRSGSICTMRKRRNHTCLGH